MSVLSCNCYRLGNEAAIQTLKHIAQTKKPSFIFKCETKLSGDATEFVKRVIGYASMFCVTARRRSGGIALLWKKAGMARILSFSNNHIDGLREVILRLCYINWLEI